MGYFLYLILLVQIGFAIIFTVDLFKFKVKNLIVKTLSVYFVHFVVLGFEVFTNYDFPGIVYSIAIFNLTLNGFAAIRQINLTDEKMYSVNIVIENSKRVFKIYKRQCIVYTIFYLVYTAHTEEECDEYISQNFKKY